MAQKTNWGWIFGGAAVAVTVIVNLLGFLTSGNDKLEKRVSKIEDDLTWKYLSKEIAAKDIGYLTQAILNLKSEKADKDISEQRLTNIERLMAFQRERIMVLEQRAFKTPP